MQEMINVTKDLIIRSSSAEFLIFERQTHNKGIQVRFEDGDLWLTQKAIGELFNVDRTVVTKHIKNIYSELELNENLTSANYALVQKEGNREITRNVLYYNLDMVISVGYRINSDRAIQFRRWATYILKEFSKKGYIIDKNRMANGAFFDEDYYDSFKFFKKIQNKMHYAVSHQTAAEIIYNRANSEKEHMGLTTWKNIRNGCCYS